MVSKASASPADYGYHNERAGHDRPARVLAQREAKSVKVAIRPGSGLSLVARHAKANIASALSRTRP